MVSMRKIQKQRIENYINLLPQICETIRRGEQADSQVDKQVIEALWRECQEGLALVRGLIADAEGESCRTLAILEQYAKTLPEGDEVLWEALRRSVAEDMKAKKEVVFLPYKASMWDSLESIWLAARDDEECEAYVVPIPYFDRDSEHHFTQMHWEGDLYPDYVPITHYTEYDICEHRPDVIFIHNPYDECNHITSVHPDYYAKQLCNYTDKLVYVPYFVLNEIEPKDQSAIDMVKHFCYLPGTRYADKVILQSDKMCEIYVNEYLKAASSSDEKVQREELKERFLGLGSPKLDKVMNARTDDATLPKEWLRLITKTNGQRKKVVLYNTSVNAFLQFKERMLLKIKEVLELFQENQDEVALLWRPHPLMKQTISMAHPKLWDEYEALVQNYREAGWGIYDDSAELDRAIAVSDAYYGDWSSLVQLYQGVGKPAMVQSIESIEGIVKRGSLRFTDSVFYKGKMYFSAWNGNGIFSYCPKTEVLKLEKLLPYSLGEIQHFGKHLLVENRLYLTPVRRDCILEINLDTWELREYYLDKKECGNLVGYQDIFEDGKDLYFLPFFSKAICRLDTETGDIFYYGQCYEAVKESVKTELPLAIWGKGARSKNQIVCPIKNTNIIMSFDMITHEVKIFEVGDERMSFLSLAYDGESCWIYSEDGRLVKWSKDKGVLNILQMQFAGAGNSICFANGCIWFVATDKGMYCKVDIETCQISEYKAYLPQNNVKQSNIDEVCVKGDYLYIYPSRSEVFVRIDTDTEEIVTNTMGLGEGEYISYMDRCIERLSESITEVQTVDPIVMMKYMLSQSFGQAGTVSCGEIGQTIYNRLK